MTNSQFRIRIVQALAEVPAAAWDACAGGLIAPSLKLTREDNSSPQLSTRGQLSTPFISHDFLSSLEASGSVGGHTGWQPRHLLAEAAGYPIDPRAPIPARWRQYASGHTGREAPEVMT